MKYCKPLIRTYSDINLIETVGPLQTAYVTFGVQQVQVTLNHDAANKIEYQQLAKNQQNKSEQIISLKEIV